MRSFTKGVMAGAILAMTTWAGAASAQQGNIPIGDGVRIHPESIAVTPDGGFLVSSGASPVVYRWRPGEATATAWVNPSNNFEGNARNFGVYAFGDTAWVCAIGVRGSGLAVLVSYDLATGTQTGAYPFPDHGRAGIGGACNDMAMSPDGTLFITETNAAGVGKVLALVPNTAADAPAGAMRFLTVVGGTSMGGADGIAFIGDLLYVNDVFAHRLYEIDVEGTVLVGFRTLTLSQPLTGPDGMRTTLDGTALLVAENGANNRISRITIDGANANVEVVRDGLTSPTGVAQIGDTIYIVEAKLGLVGGAADPGPFAIIAAPLN